MKKETLPTIVLFEKSYRFMGQLFLQFPLNDKLIITMKRILSAQWSCLEKAQCLNKYPNNLKLAFIDSSLFSLKLKNNSGTVHKIAKK